LEQRKIVSLGRSSLVISLPKLWTKLNELKQGDLVSLTVQRDRSLMVFPGSYMEKEDKKITLQIEQGEETSSISRKIIACYLNGYFGIQLVAKNIFSVSQQKGIRETVGRLYMRIMESDSKHIYIQTLIDETKASVDAGVHRMEAISVSMFRDAMNSFKTRDKELAKIVYSSDDDVDHFSFFVLRLLNQIASDPVLANQLGLEAVDCLHYQTIVNKIEQVGDCAKNIAKYAILLEDERQKVSERVMELVYNTGNETYNAYERAVKSFFSKDVSEANRIIDFREKIEKMDLEITSKFFSEPQGPTICCAICSIRDNIRETMEHASDIAEITIDRSYKEE
jgi:phosphate uptake regulator